jgi:hypothetical protein
MILGKLRRSSSVLFSIAYMWSALLLTHCTQPPTQSITQEQDSLKLPAQIADKKLTVEVKQDVRVEEYFNFMDSIVLSLDTLLEYPLTEHILVWANPWIIDTLVSTDYYHQMEQGHFIYDQRKLTVLPAGRVLSVPGPERAAAIQAQLRAIMLDVNLPEFQLRIFCQDSLLHQFPVRVGRNERKYLETAGRVVDLRTPVGEGQIVRIDRNPDFVDPVTGDAFTTTKRDDGRRTMMPMIPWLEPAINGIRYGSMIHPTTNPSTLGKAYSNGCIGTSESAAWIIYYHAPVGTAVHFRYDLTVTDEEGKPVTLKDIY